MNMTLLLTTRLEVAAVRIFQSKMSLGKCRESGKLRVNVNHDAGPRRGEFGTNEGVGGKQSGGAICHRGGKRCTIWPNAHSRKREGYHRLTEISAGHLYKLRKSAPYRKVRVRAVDTVTQWQVVGCVEMISENHLLPGLEAMLHQFPFVIRGFHSDYIASEHAEAMEKFLTAHFNRYLNFRRPCGFATIQTAARGRRKRTYKADDCRTPFENPTSLPDWEKYLKPGLSAEHLRNSAQKFSDTEAARNMQRAKAAVLAAGRRLR